MNVLKAVIEAHLKEISKVYEKIEERRKRRDPIAMESLAYQLHNLILCF